MNRRRFLSAFTAVVVAASAQCFSSKREVCSIFSKWKAAWTDMSMSQITFYREVLEGGKKKIETNQHPSDDLAISGGEEEKVVTFNEAYASAITSEGDGWLGGVKKWEIYRMQDDLSSSFVTCALSGDV